MLAMLKDQILNPDASTTKKVPIAEKESRLELQRRRLAGVLIEAHSEPSHALLDLVTQIHDTNILRFVPLEKCCSRMHELSNLPSKSQSKHLELESSKLIVKDKEQELESSVNSAYQVIEAMKRRGLAFDFAGIMNFRCHEKYTQTLFNHLNRDPPPGFSRATVAQLIAADKAAWTKCIELGIKPRPNAAGEVALDVELLKALESYEVSFTLLPLPQKNSQHPSKPPSQSSPSQPVAKQPKQKGKGKQRFAPYGKGKGKTKYEQRIPQQIRDAGGTASTPSGEPICFDHSLKKCKSTVSLGERCAKGLHVCAICYGLRSMLDHKSS